MPATKLVVALVSASVLREGELPGFEAVSDFASESYNLAIGSIAAWIQSLPDLSAQVSLHLCDFSISWDKKVLSPTDLNSLLSIKPDVIGLSCYCWSIDTLIDLAAQVRRHFPHCFIVAGGPSVGPCAKQILQKHRELDLVVEGEGEDVFASILRARLKNKSMQLCPNIWFRDPSGSCCPGLSSSNVSPSLDLALAPSPYRTGTLRPKSHSLLLETSRGCKYRCRFCSWMGGGQRLRYVPIDSIRQDLQWAIENGYRQVKIADTAINFDTARLAELTSTIRQVDPEKKLRFTYFLKPELLDDTQAALLLGIPADEIIIGVESTNNVARKSVAKGPFDRAQFDQMMQRLHPLGPVTASFIMGLPGDTPEGLSCTLDDIVNYDIAHPDYFHVICLFWLALLPGSRLHAQMEKASVRCMPRGTPYLLESDYQSPDSLLQMARLAVQKHYAHPKLRVEYFHKEFLAQDAPLGDRHVAIPRRATDARTLICISGEIDEQAFLHTGTNSYSIEATWLKGLLEQSSRFREHYRVELVDLPSLVSHRNSHQIIVFRQNVESVSLPSTPAASVTDALILEWSIFRDRDALAKALARFGSFSPSTSNSLDWIPSPFQWGFVQRPTLAIVMRLGLDDCSSEVSSYFSPSRIEADIRWAIEQRHHHIIWADRRLPSDSLILSGIVSAIHKADPTNRIRHTFRAKEPSIEQRHVLADLLVGEPWWEPIRLILDDGRVAKVRLIKIDEGDGETIRLTLEVEKNAIVHVFLSREGQFALKMVSGDRRPSDLVLAGLVRSLKSAI
jgi:radical SAM superfamily enzyme YgiQ (UPF0313 family)